MKPLRVATLFYCLLAPALDCAFASEIPGLFGTGFLGDGSPAPEGATDLHYVVVSSPFSNGTNAVVLEESLRHAFAYVPNSANSKWLRAGPGVNFDAGEWVYRTTFDLTGLLPYTAKITGQCAADDGLRILINSLPLPPFTNWYAFLTSFSITNGFVEGTNTLDFVVTNLGGSSPTAIRIEQLRGTAVDPNTPPLSIRISEVELCWPAATNKTYQVQYRSALTTNLWTDLGSTIPGTNGFICIRDSVTDVQRFYRLQVTP